MKHFFNSSLLIFAVLLTTSVFAYGNISGNNTNFAKPSNSFSVTNKCNESKLIDIYKSVDGKILNSGDEKMVRAYLIDINKKVATYLQTNYPQLGPTDVFNVEDVDFAVFGLVYALAEYGGHMESSTVSREIPAWLQCVGGVLGVTAIYELVSGAATATYASTWSVVKKLVKRYVGWLGVGLALWEIATECF